MLPIVAAMALGACGKVYTPETEARTFKLPAGTQIHVSPTQPVPMDEVRAGDLFTGVLADPVIMEGVVIAPRGVPAAGEFVVEPASGAPGVQPVGVMLTTLTVHGGEEAMLDTTPIFPQQGALSDGVAELSEDAELMFVLREPAEVSWSMDLDPSDSATM